MTEKTHACNFWVFAPKGCEQKKMSDIVIYAREYIHPERDRQTMDLKVNSYKEYEHTKNLIEKFSETKAIADKAENNVQNDIAIVVDSNLTRKEITRMAEFLKKEMLPNQRVFLLHDQPKGFESTIVRGMKDVTKIPYIGMVELCPDFSLPLHTALINRTPA